MTTTTPRGIRNKNPLNIRIGNNWLGEDPHPTDSEFEQFVSVRYGLRAGFCILCRYIRRYKRDTITKIVHSWAPSTENDCAAYIKVVAHRSGIDPDAQIDYKDSVTMCKLVQAMAFVECGRELDIKLIEDAYKIA